MEEVKNENVEVVEEIFGITDEEMEEIKEIKEDE